MIAAVTAGWVVTSLPIDLYLEVPDDQGGFVRFYEAVEIVRAAAPVYLKMGFLTAGFRISVRQRSSGS